MSCVPAVGRPICANILEGKGKGLFMETGTCMGFCCGSLTLGDGADTSALNRKLKKQMLAGVPGR